ncbi:MAG: hypothetical protein PHR12_01740 [Victivallaceae bacterium]|nr:hypothetical protein [Victivallaceae bacterium]MDD3702931.1 hypothetical protein [Victivallaceae bacterium]
MIDNFSTFYTGMLNLLFFDTQCFTDVVFCQSGIAPIILFFYRVIGDILQITEGFRRLSPISGKCLYGILPHLRMRIVQERSERGNRFFRVS